MNQYLLTRWLFLRLLGGIYLIAFASLAVQLPGLLGQRGIAPAQNLLQSVFQQLGIHAYWRLPTLAWLDSGDFVLQGLSWGGMGIAILVIFNLATRWALLVAWVFYLSLVNIGAPFTSFQWDILLLEAGFLAIFLETGRLRPQISPLTFPSLLFLGLLKWLLFRLMFASGIAKIASGDPTWKNLTALNFHYETQPLPTPLAWYIHQLPEGFHQFSVGMMFVIELVAPFFIFGPRRMRLIAAATLALLQILILFTGNYTFFNWLTLILCLLLLDDAILARIVPQQWQPRFTPSPSIDDKPSENDETVPKYKRNIQWKNFPLCLIACLIFILSSSLFFRQLAFKTTHPPFLIKLQNQIAPFRIVGTYGLFAVMTTRRSEIIIEGSPDGKNWQTYDFHYKPSDLQQSLPWVAPHQPRLDWQMWFAALGTPSRNPWFLNFLGHLLIGTPEVLSLLQTNPFPDQPPQYVRALLYDYRFTNWEDRQKDNTIWKREFRQVYVGPVSLK